MKTPLELTAYHEAGHALIYYLLGNQIVSITIDGFGNGNFISYCYKPSYLIEKKNCPHLAVMSAFALRCLSGYASECTLIRGEIDMKYYFENTQIKKGSIPSTDGEELLDEMNKVNEIIGKKHYGLEFMNNLWDLTVELINQPNNWNAIDKLSEKLINSPHNYLNFNEIHKTLDSFNLTKFN